MQNEGLESSKRHYFPQLDEAGSPDFLVETDKEGRFRLWFRNRLEAPVTVGDWTLVTVSPRSFVNMVDNLLVLLREMVSEE